MKIKELQFGGLLTYEPMNMAGGWQAPQLINTFETEPQSSGKSAGSSRGSDDNLISKDVMRQLMENGLSSDIAAYTAQLKSINPQLLENPRTAYRHLVSQIDMVNKIRQNKEALDGAVKMANSNNGLNEYAVTSTGQIIVQDSSGKLKQVSPSDYKENSDSYQPLTNAQLASLRKNNLSFAFNTNIADVIENAIGPDKISEYILNIASKIGQDKFTREGYVNKKQERVAEGIQELLAGGPDGVYKITQSGEDEERKMQKQAEALNYIMSVLPQNMKNQLQAKSAIEGTDPHRLIIGMIDFTSKRDESTKVDYDSAASKAAGSPGASNDGSSAVESQSQTHLFLQGRSTSQRFMEFNTGSDYSIVQFGEWWQAPQDLGTQQPINKSMTLDRLLTETSVAGAVDPGSVYFGNQAVTEDQFKNIVYNNSDGIATIMLPYVVDESGHKKPDFAIAEQLSKAAEEIKAKGANISDVEKREIFKDNHVEEFFDMVYLGRDADPNKVARFMAFSGLATNDKTYGNFSTKDKFVSVNRTGYRDIYTNIYEAAMNESVGKEGATTVNNWYNWAFGGGDILSGTVYIPLTDDNLSAYTASKTLNVPRMETMTEGILQRSAQNRAKANIAGPTSLR